MSAQVEIPAALQGFTNNQQMVDVPRGTVQDAFNSLFEQFGSFASTCTTRRGSCAASSTST